MTLMPSIKTTENGKQVIYVRNKAAGMSNVNLFKCMANCDAFYEQDEPLIHGISLCITEFKTKVNVKAYTSFCT